MAEKRNLKNCVQKLSLRQIRGCLQPLQRSNPVRFFTEYSRNCCFKFNELLDLKGEIKDGHVVLGFTKDGSHLLSYTMVIDTRLELPCPLYSYVLHWWRFTYNKPLIKVHSVELFYNQSISDALHLIISESLDEKQVIVWGRSLTSPEQQSCRCYVTICASISLKPCKACQEEEEKCVEHSFAIHFTYETLPPYPVFLPFASLRIPGVVLFNCGDSLVAMKCTPCSHNGGIEKGIQEFTTLGDMVQKCDMRHQSYDETELCENMVRIDGLHVTQISHTSENCGDFQKEQDENSNNLVSLNHVKETSTSSNMVPSQLTSRTLLHSALESDSIHNDYQTKYSFKTYSHCDNLDSNTCDDVIDRELPVTVVCNSEMELHPTSTSPSCDTPSVTVCQAFLDMEECINELIGSHNDLRDRYKSLCDYDSQFLSTCPDTGDIIVMVNVLIYAKPANISTSEGLQVSPRAQLQRTGFVFAWNIWNGLYRTLHYLDVENYLHGKDFSRSEYSKISSRKLLRHTAVPVGFASQVRVFSNHTVFTEKSLRYLIHPFLPIVIVF